MTYKRKATRTPTRSRMSKYVRRDELEIKEYFSNALTSVPAGQNVPLTIANIPTGTGSNQKIGSKVRVISVELIGTLSQTDVSVTLYISKPTLALAANDFVGPYVTNEHGTELFKYYGAETGGLAFQYKKKMIGRGMVIEFDRDTTTVAVGQTLGLNLFNPSPAAQTVRWYARVRYTDA